MKVRNSIRDFLRKRFPAKACTEAGLISRIVNEWYITTGNFIKQRQ